MVTNSCHSICCQQSHEGCSGMFKCTNLYQQVLQLMAYVNFKVILRGKKKRKKKLTMPSKPRRKKEEQRGRRKDLLLVAAWEEKKRSVSLGKSHLQCSRQFPQAPFSQYMGACSNSQLGVPACGTGSSGESMYDQMQVLHVVQWLGYVCANMIGTCPLDL